MATFPPDELARRIDEILFYVWDPIVVRNTASARHEYRSYVKKILSILKEDKGQHEISYYLEQLESGMLAGAVNHKRLDKVARQILDHKDAIDAGLA